MKSNVTKISNSLEFNSFVKEIKNRILKSQYEALKKVNKELIGLYLSIGEDIVNKQGEYGWGKSIVEKLSDELRKEFVGIKGFSVQNLWNMRQFYLEYKDNSKLQPLVGEIGWTKNVVIFQKRKDDLEREFYIKSTIKFGWTKNLLIHHIDNQSYEKYLLNQTNFDKSLPSDVYLKQAKLSVKDEYNFSFLELGDNYSEICKEKNRTIVEYALRENTQPMGVSTYQTSKILPKNLQQYLPNTEEIENSLMNFLEEKDEK